MNWNALYQTVVSIASENLLVERLFFASLEFAALALVVAVVIWVCNITTPRLIALLWLVVLVKPVVSLVIGSPIPVVQVAVVPTESLANQTPLSDELEIKSPQSTASLPNLIPMRESSTTLRSNSLRARDGRSQLPVPTATGQATASYSSAVEPQRTVTAGQVFTGIWITGLLVFLAKAAWGRIRLRELVRHSALADQGLRSQVLQLSSELALKKAPKVRVTEQIECAALVGDLNPVVLIPAWLVEHGKHDPSTLSWSIRHELMHWKLRDPIANLIRELSQVLFFFHPFAWWASKKWRQSTELACDRALVTSETEATNYAEGLYKVLASIHGRRRISVSSSLFATRTQIGRRIEILLNHPLQSSSRMTAMMVMGVIALSIASLSVGGRFAKQARASEPSDIGTTSTAQDPETTEVREDNQVKSDHDGQSKLVSVRGRVLDPAGKPLDGADVTLWSHFGYWGYYKSLHPQSGKPLQPKFVAKSKPDGSFEFSVALSEISDNPMNIWMECWMQIVAAKPGYGPAWGNIRVDQANDKELQLVKDDVRVEGRLVDLQGRPVPDATMAVEYIVRGGDEFRALRQPTWAGLTGAMDNGVLRSSCPLNSDKDGRFQISGIGRDRVARLIIKAPTIAHQEIVVNTTRIVDGKPVDHTSVELVAEPTKPIVGTIRAKESGKPLPGVVVYGSEGPYRRTLRAITDENGRFRLTGLPKAGAYDLSVYPPTPLGYLATVHKLVDSEGLTPIKADLELRRGVKVRLRLVDKVSGKPVRAALHATPLKTNEHYREAEVAPGYMPTREWNRVYAADMQGVFEIVAYPGPSLIVANLQANAFKYVSKPLDPLDKRKAAGDPIMGFAELMGVYRLLEITNTDEPVVFDLELDPGSTVNGTLIDEDSKPVLGATAFGLNYHSRKARNSNYKPAWESTVLETESFTIGTVVAETPRTVSFIHQERGLIAHQVLNGNETEELTLRMQKWGTVTGRLVNSAGVPQRGINVNLQYASLPAPGLKPSDSAVVTDAEGGFRVEGLVPGLDHSLTLATEKEEALSSDDVLRSVKVGSGEIKHLGDVTVQVKTDKQ